MTSWADWFEEYPVPPSLELMNEEDRQLWIEALIDSFCAGYGHACETLILEKRK